MISQTCRKAEGRSRKAEVVDGIVRRKVEIVNLNVQLESVSKGLQNSYLPKARGATALPSFSRRAATPKAWRVVSKIILVIFFHFRKRTFCDKSLSPASISTGST